MLIEVGVSPQTPNQPEIQKGFYPTGNHVVIKREAISRIFNATSAEAVLKHGKAFVDFETFGLLTASENKQPA